MGREIRRVPANWEHPKTANGDYDALFDNLDGAIHDFQEEIDDKGLKEALTNHSGGPNPEAYVDYEGKEETWYQAYETVSEGCPITPPFETKQELIDYLVMHGDFWGKSWPREGAESFVKDEWAPSMVLSSGKIYTPENMHELDRKKEER